MTTKGNYFLFIKKSVAILFFGILIIKMTVNSLTKVYLVLCNE